MIEWNRVTKSSQIVAIILFVVVFIAGFFLGKYAEKTTSKSKLSADTNNLPIEVPLKDIHFTCENNKKIEAKFFATRALFNLSDGRKGTLPLAMSTSSASGARYTNANESFIFLMKGSGASIKEGTTTTYANCVAE